MVTHSPEPPGTLSLSVQEIDKDILDLEILKL